MISAALLSLVVAAAPWAEGGPSRGEDLAVSLVTFAPGDDIPSWWGHTALVVEDRTRNQGRLYNYGMFDFSTGFVHKFVQGRLEFWVGEAPIMGTYQLYKSLDRDVRIQELNLTPEQRLQVARALALNVTPEHRDYLYHHYNDNCSTRPRDMIDLAFDGQLKAATNVPARMKLREHTRRYSSVFAPMSLILDYLQNDELDRPITQQQEAFLPDELERQLDLLKVKGPDGTEQPAVARKWSYYTSSTRRVVPEVAPQWIPMLLVFGAVLGGGGYLLRRQQLKATARWARVAFGLLNALVGLVWGSLGVFLFIVGLFTNHQVAHRNENLFLIHPITFALLPLGIMYAVGSKKGTTGLRYAWLASLALLVVGVLVKVLPMFDQNNWNLIAMAAPVTVGMALSFILEKRR